MILNPSHEITLRGLPSEILDAYVRYKKGSRAIVSWLVQFGPHQYRGVKTLPIKELASLAQSVVTNIKVLPDVIHFHFKETIAARKRLSQYFRKSIDLSRDDADTVNHEHFTESLTQIYSDLCQRCQTSSGIEKHASSCTSCPSTLAEPVRNHYACLPVEDCGDGLTSVTASNDCEECHHETIHSCSGVSCQVEIENDELGIAIETAATLERMHGLIEAVQFYWERAGRGDSHFVSAAAVTNIAWSNLRALECSLKHSDEHLDLGVLRQRCCLFKNAALDSDEAPSKAHALLKTIESSERAILHYLNCHKLTIIAHCPSCVQKPSDYVQHAMGANGEQDANLPLALMDNMLHLMCGTKSTQSMLHSSPMFFEISYLLTHRDDRSNAFSCTLALHLLTTVYKAYLPSLPSPSMISTCRITALKLSKQASATLDLLLDNKDSFPCRCPETLAFHLANLKSDMDAYSKYKRWDLYFQSPWVAGNQAIEMLDTLSYYGMRLFHYRHYVGSVLHSYNVLVQLAGFEKIPLLEDLCEIFKDAFFPSGKPTMHFKNSWARYIGARLKFKKGHKRLGNDKDSWCMAVPAHAAKGSAGFGIEINRSKMELEPKFDYARIDPMMKLKQIDWSVDVSTPSLGEPMSRRTTNSTSTSTSVSISRPTSSSSASTAFSCLSLSTHSDEPTPTTHPLLTHQQTLDTSLLQRGGTTTLNHLAIFHTATTLINTMTTKLHTDPSDADSKLCICFAQTLLTAADRIVEGRRFGGVACWRKEERAVVDIVVAALREVFGGDRETKVRGEWVWDL